MSGAIEIDFNSSEQPLELVLVNLSGAGIPGQACTVAIRLTVAAGGYAAGDYLDWSTNTFKAAGWGVKNEPMTDLGNGTYQALLPVAALGFTTQTPLPVYLAAEYTQNGQGVGDVEYLTISELRPDGKRNRQYNTNKLDALAPGDLTLYDDDGVTVVSTQTLTDATGGPTVDQPNAPQKRGSTPL